MKPPTLYRWRTGAALAALAVVLSTPAFASENVEPAYHRKFDRAVHDAVRAGANVRALVRFSNDSDLRRAAQIVTSRGGAVGREADGQLLTVSADAQTIDMLAADATVLHVSTDAEVRPMSDPTEQPRSWRRRGARSREESISGSGRGIAVAVIDSGLQPHPDLPASRIRAFVDFIGGRTEPYDDFGHGTHVAGIIAGTGAASAGVSEPYVGIAPSVDIVALKVLDGSGRGRASDVIAALEWVLANYQTYNIRVVNISLGHPVFEPASTDPLVQAAEALVRRGIVVVASAGNQGINPQTGRVGYGGIVSPADGPSLIAVGAVDDEGTAARSDDRVTDYSSRGPTRFELLAKPDLVARGHHIVSLAAPGSTLYSYSQLLISGGSEPQPLYERLSGTSMAAPMVSGAAALVLGVNPQLRAATVKMLLQFTAQSLPETDRLTQGAGYLNAVGAVRLAQLVRPDSPTGSFWLRRRALPVPGDTIAGEPVVWSKNIVWGNRVLQGDAAYVHMAAWNDNIVWGQALDNIVWGNLSDNIVWGNLGDNIVWGNSENIVWGNFENIVWGNLSDNIVWGNLDDNIVWGNSQNIVWGQTFDNIVWGNNIVWNDNIVSGYWADNIVWGFWADNIVWGNVTRSMFDSDNIVWGNAYLDNIVWGNADGADNIVWGNADNIVWGNSLAVLTGGLF